MKKLLYVLLGIGFLVTGSASGQAKLALSATVAPVYVQTRYDRLFLYPDSDGQIVEPVYLDGTRGAPGYRAGLTLRYLYAPGWSVGTGFWYQHTSIRQARPALAGEGTTTLRNRTLRIPLLLNAEPGKGRLTPAYTLGLLVDIPMASRVTVTRGDQPTQQLRLTSDGGPAFGVLLGAGATYRPSDRYTLTAQPTFIYNLGQLGSRDKVRGLDLGLQFQVNYLF